MDGIQHRCTSPHPGAHTGTDTGTHTGTDTGTDPDVVELYAALRVLNDGIHQHRTRTAAELELAPSDVAALMEVAAHEDIRPTELAHALRLGNAATTNITGKLERSGYLRRSPHPTDRRGLRLSLTPAGRHAVAWISETTGALIRSALSPDGHRAIDPALVTTVATVLRDLGSALAGPAAEDSDTLPVETGDSAA